MSTLLFDKLGINLLSFVCSAIHLQFGVFLNLSSAWSSSPYGTSFISTALFCAVPIVTVAPLYNLTYSPNVISFCIFHIDAQNGVFLFLLYVVIKSWLIIPSFFISSRCSIADLAPWRKVCFFNTSKSPIL